MRARREFRHHTAEGRVLLKLAAPRCSMKSGVPGSVALDPSAAAVSSQLVSMPRIRIRLARSFVRV